jgi:hypothetical protein
MAKVIVNKRANIYHDNGNNKVDFEDNLYRILSRNREYVNKLLSGEKVYPDIPQPIPSGYIYPTSWSEDSDWAELMTEPYSTEHTTDVSFEQEGKVATVEIDNLFGFEKQPCVAVINCDIGDTAGVTLSAKLLGMVPGYLDQSESWEDIAGIFSAELAFLDSTATLTFTTDEDVTINSITVYYTESTPPEPPVPPTTDYITASSTEDNTNSLAPLVTPTAETEVDEENISDKFSQDGDNVQAGIYDTCVSPNGGYLLLGIAIDGVDYTLLAQAIKNEGYSYGSAIHQYFTAGNYTVDVAGEETYDSPHLIISATDIDSHSVTVTLNSAKRYFGAN